MVKAGASGLPNGVKETVGYLRGQGAKRGSAGLPFLQHDPEFCTGFKFKGSTSSFCSARELCSLHSLAFSKVTASDAATCSQRLGGN